jgi:hypothetical protein
VPPLQQSDLATLGDDVLSGNTAGRAVPNGGGAGRGGGYYGDFASWVLTRLHTRYAKETLSEDLIFRQAKPVVGGRAGWDSSAQEQPGEVRADSSNNFQARYIIRHYFLGEVKCKDPLWGRWGGPPGGEQSLQAAQNLAAAPRGQVVLSNVVRSSLPALGLPGKPAPQRKK